MAIKKTKSKISSNRDNLCIYCNKGFSRPKTLLAHMCVKKQRYNDRNTPGGRKGLYVFRMYCSMATNSTKVKSDMDFINNNFYMAFVKFGRYLLALQPIDSDGFIRYLVMNSIKIDEWTSEETHEKYLEEYSQKEPAEKALERTVITMQEWAEENNDVYVNFFKSVHPVEATYLIRGGRISPWVIFLSQNGYDLLEKMSTEQIDIIANMIDADFWQKQIMKNKDDAKFIRDILKEAGI